MWSSSRIDNYKDEVVIPITFYQDSAHYHRCALINLLSGSPSTIMRKYLDPHRNNADGDDCEGAGPQGV